MNKIIPITDLRNTNDISSLCKKENKPVFVTKNGYSDLVIMSKAVYESLENSNIAKSTNVITQKNIIKPQCDCMGFIKVAAVNFDVSINSIANNASNIISKIKEAYKLNAKIIVFPELALTSATCGDMFLQKTLINNVEKGIKQILDSTKDIDAFITFGAPLLKDEILFNTAIAIHKGEILGVVPKTNISPMSETNEGRYFTSYQKENSTITILNKEVPFGTKLLFKNSRYIKETIGLEIGNDLELSISPSTYHALNGANIICNLASDTETVNKCSLRKSIVKNQSLKSNVAYIFCSSSIYESTSDLIFSGHNIISENGHVLSETENLFKSNMILNDIDMDNVSNKKDVLSYKENRGYQIIYFESNLTTPLLNRKYKKLPFVEENYEDLKRFTINAINMQGQALARRLSHIHSKNVVLGISGGLDSTIALFGCVEAFKILGISPKGIHAITMPCFGTSARTKNNAIALSNYFGITLKEINIDASVKQHLQDIGHDINDHSVTYENAQARERTQILMDYANKVNGLVIGTGDLSEIALGWSTYNGDHMSMYSLNTTFPKTLIRAMMPVLAEFHPQIGNVLLDILGTPISPELIPPKDGVISQLTEDIVGPYELHDFFIYHFLYEHMDIKKVYEIAKLTFKDDYRPETIKKWLISFLKRFFNNQFKRSCVPDGPKITEVSLSPRGDLKLPSDGSYIEFLNELESE